MMLERLHFGSARLGLLSSLGAVALASFLLACLGDPAGRSFAPTRQLTPDEQFEERLIQYHRASGIFFTVNAVVVSRAEFAATMSGSTPWCVQIRPPGVPGGKVEVHVITPCPLLPATT